MKRSFLSIAFAAVAGLVFAGSECKAAAKVDPSVIKDLQSAYNGEMNASAKYKMYAEQAAKAGYKSVEAMFKATSFSESRHAARHAKVLKSFGVTPKSQIKLPAYTGVADSLRDGIKGETYEKTTMYPNFIKNAKAKKAPASVIQTFTFALEAEKIHADLYADALANLEQWKAAGKTFYICTVCGYTTTSPVKVCILCAAPGEKFQIFK